MVSESLFPVYLHLISLTLVGWGLGRTLPSVVPVVLGKFLFWVGIPIGIFAFLRQATLSFSLWLAPVVACTSIVLGGSLGWFYLRWRSQQGGDRCLSVTKGSFLLSSMVGNTGYIGYPVSLALFGQDYFSWAMFFDLGSTVGAYGLGAAMASRFGIERENQPSIAREMLLNPALWGMAAGLVMRPVSFPAPLEKGLVGIGWFTISLALVLIGMRLSQISSIKGIRLAIASIGIKMLVVPLLVGLLLLACGVSGLVHRVLLLQMAMPPAFATLILAEAYELDKTLTVTSLTIGSLGLLFTLPIWLWLFPINLPN